MKEIFRELLGDNVTEVDLDRLVAAVTRIRADVIVGVLDTIAASQEQFRWEAARRGISLNQLIAKAIVDTIQV